MGIVKEQAKFLKKGDEYSLNKGLHEFSCYNILISPWFLRRLSFVHTGHFNFKAKAKYHASFGSGDNSFAWA